MTWLQRLHLAYGTHSISLIYSNKLIVKVIPLQSVHTALQARIWIRSSNAITIPLYWQHCDAVATGGHSPHGQPYVTRKVADVSSIITILQQLHGRWIVDIIAFWSW